MPSTAKNNGQNNNDAIDDKNHYNCPTSTGLLLSKDNAGGQNCCYRENNSYECDASFTTELSIKNTDTSEKINNNDNRINEEVLRFLANNKETSNTKKSSRGRRRRGGINANYNNNKNAPFPVVLHEVLSEVENYELEHIISWQPHGRCFLVHDEKAFVTNILQFWFRQTKFSSFHRQLNIYGFRRIVLGRDKGGFYHEMFLRGKPWLCRHIQRDELQTSDKGQYANFYEMEFLPPTTNITQNPNINASNYSFGNNISVAIGSNAISGSVPLVNTPMKQSTMQLEFDMSTTSKSCSNFQAGPTQCCNPPLCNNFQHTGSKASKQTYQDKEEEESDIDIDWSIFNNNLICSNRVLETACLPTEMNNLCAVQRLDNFTAPLNNDLCSQMDGEISNSSSGDGIFHLECSRSQSQQMMGGTNEINDSIRTTNTHQNNPLSHKWSGTKVEFPSNGHDANTNNLLQPEVLSQDNLLPEALTHLSRRGA